MLEHRQKGQCHPVLIEIVQNVPFCDHWVSWSYSFRWGTAWNKVWQNNNYQPISRIMRLLYFYIGNLQESHHQPLTSNASKQTKWDLFVLNHVKLTDMQLYWKLGIFSLEQHPQWFIIIHSRHVVSLNCSLCARQLDVHCCKQALPNTSSSPPGLLWIIIDAVLKRKFQAFSTAACWWV